MENLPQKKQLGQALLVILLVLFVALTIALTLIARTTTDIKLSREMEESSRALSAAEAGIEEGLKGVVASGPQEITPGISFNVVSQEAGPGSGSFSLGKLEEENAGTVWFTNHDSDGNLIETEFYGADRIALCWNKADTDIPSIETIILYKTDAGEYKATRAFYGSTVSGSSDPNACNDPSKATYPYQTDISLPSGETLLVLRLKPVGGDAFVVVDPPGDNSLPSQGEEIVSTGKAGETVRKVRVVKSYPSWPEIFDYVLFSGGGLTK